MLKTKTLLSSFLFLGLFSAPAISHSGGLNSRGCHNDRINHSYHCHRSSSSIPALDFSLPASPVRATVEDRKRIEIPSWTGRKPHYDYSWAQCIIQGPTNLRLEPNLNPDVIRATIGTNSCGHLITYNGNFALLEFYIVEVEEVRRYWVHESQFTSVIHPQE